MDSGSAHLFSSVPRFLLLAACGLRLAIDKVCTFVKLACNQSVFLTARILGGIETFMWLWKGL